MIYVFVNNFGANLKKTISSYKVAVLEIYFIANRKVTEVSAK